MPSPFPGMDPYLESPKYWSDFHVRFIAHWAEALNRVMPEHYVARAEERIQLIGDEESLTRPDISVMRSGPLPLRAAENQVVQVAVLEREPVILPVDILEEEVVHYIRILRHPGRTLVAVLELLSPSNKVDPGRSEYLAHRNQMLRQSVHLVELDLLVGGRRLPARSPLPLGDYYAFVARAERRPHVEAYAWSVRERLPVIRIPLSGPDPDVLLDIQPVFNQVYDNGRCRADIDYRQPLKASLSESDLAWTRERGEMA